MALSSHRYFSSRQWLLSLLVALAPLCLSAPAAAAGVPNEELYSAWWTGSLLASPGRTLPFGHSLVEPYLIFSKPLAPDSGYAFQSLAVVQAGIGEKFDLQLLLQGAHQAGGGASSTQLGDTRVQLAFQLVDAEKGAWIPDLLFFVRETFPTGRYDQLDPKRKGTDASGGGAFSTGFGANLQKVVLMPNLHPLRLRLNLAFQVPNRVAIRGLSVYNSTPETTGDVFPGKSFSALIAGEYHLTERWVVALDLNYAHGNADSFVGDAGTTADGRPVAVGNSSRDRFTFAPAIEYNFTGDVGVVGGFSMDVGRNVSTAISPTIAINIFH